MYQYGPTIRRRRYEPDFTGLAGSVLAADPRTNAQCRADERRIRPIVEPAPGELAAIAARHLADASRPKQMHRAAYGAYLRMKAAAEAAGVPVNLLTITSGYRSVAHQQRLWAEALKRYGSPQAARKWVAPPGGSPHHTGRAIDLWLGTRNSSDNIAALRATLPYKWLVCNAVRFGFFPYANEPWHWEYNPDGLVSAAPRPPTPPPPRPAPAARPSAASESQLIVDAVRKGIRDENRLTNLVFHARHPERRSRPLRQDEQPVVKEWLEIRDRIVRPGLGKSTMGQGFGQVVEPDAWLRASRQAGLGQGPAPLPRIANVTFRNSGAKEPNNCCTRCPQNLGVGIDLGSGPTASNGMELQFTLSGHRSGIEYDILRTRRNSLWERRGGVWTRLESQPMGTSDDHHNADECLIPRGNKIFVGDHPGYSSSVLPRPDGIRFGGLTPGVSTHADATDIVLRLSFAEWVIARSRAEGVPWTPLELPPARDGKPRQFTFWHNIVWLNRDGSNQWVLDRARSRIAPGSLSAAVITSAPA